MVGRMAICEGDPWRTHTHSSHLPGNRIGWCCDLSISGLDLIPFSYLCQCSRIAFPHHLISRHHVKDTRCLGHQKRRLLQPQPRPTPNEHSHVAQTVLAWLNLAPLICVLMPHSLTPVAQHCDSSHGMGSSPFVPQGYQSSNAPPPSLCSSPPRRLAAAFGLKTQPYRTSIVVGALSGSHPDL